jgi:polygalacturonase
MKNFFRLLTISVLSILIFSYTKENNDWGGMSEILNRIKVPVFPDKEFPITNYGAKGDGKTDCTEAIRKAIDACTLDGGGRVVVPEGKFLTGAVHLKNNVNLYLSEKAILLFSKDTKKYLPVVKTRFESNDLMNYSPFIYAFGQENIAVTGTGTLDGNADEKTWWPWKGNKKGGWNEGMPTQKNDNQLLVKMSDENVPAEKRIFGEGHYLRPSFIQFYNCKNILIEGVKIIRSPMWEINPVLSSNITVRRVSIKSLGPNNDGCDPESCKDMLVDNCFFETGDDCIAIKSGRDEDGRRINTPCENIIISNSEMSDGHAGVAIGSEISGNCRNVYVENCKMNSPNLDRALRLKSNSTRGGIIENIYMRNCTVGEVGQAVILADLYYNDGDVGKNTPIIRNVFVDNVTSQKSEYALWFKGYERSPITNIQITNCKFNGVKNGNMLLYTKDIQYKNLYINGQKIEEKK